MPSICGAGIAGFSILLTVGVVRGADSGDEPATLGRIEEQTPTQINRNITDPVSLTWSLKLENDISFLDIDGHGSPVQDTFSFQPTLPVLLTPYLKLITRPQFTLVDSVPFTNFQGDLDRTTGVGDTTLDLGLSPVSDPWIIALGPTFIFPTANLDRTGQGKWQVGPVAAFGYRAKEWLGGFIAQQWWSFAGSSSRPSVSQLNLQYIASYFFGDGWSVGTDPIMTVNWRGKSGNQVTFPFGPFIAKVVKFTDALPIKFQLDGSTYR